MKIDRSLLSGSTKMLVLGLFRARDKYGYEMITQLSLLSKDVFDMKEGTLYPVLHSLEKEGCVKSYDKAAESGRVRRYYHLTDRGRLQLQEQTEQWQAFSGAVNMVLKPEG